MAIMYPMLWIYDAVLLNNIAPRVSSTELRIGYINLHENPISTTDLQRMKNYDCDLWCFLEWNGDNFNKSSDFQEGYIAILDEPDPTTFGSLILSKSPDVSVREIAKEHRPYACDYPMHEVLFLESPIYLLHAPPNLPGCGYETADYIGHFIEAQEADLYGTGIIVGDLNSLPASNRIQNLLSAGYQNSFKETNSLPQGTFGGLPLLPKLLQLDHVLHKGAIKPQLVKRFSISSSDHSGYIADFTILKK